MPKLRTSLGRLSALCSVFGLLAISGCTNSTTEETASEPSVVESSTEEPSTDEPQIDVPSLIQTYDYDPTLFTQGFEFNANGDLIVGTGLYGDSEIGVFDLDTNTFHSQDTLPEEYFGEGITHTPDYLWQLTWREGVAFKRDPFTREIIGQAEYDGEGWGLAYDTDRDFIYMSDGSDTIQIRDAVTFELENSFQVSHEDTGIDALNELEYANQKLYANIWYENIILEINPEDGSVTKMFDVGPLLEDLDLDPQLEDNIDSLNGIAHIEDDEFLLTGKYYPVIFQVKLN